MSKNKAIEVKGTAVNLFQSNKEDYLSLTDIAKSKEGDSRAADVIKNWLRNRGTLEFIGTWEEIYNPNFKVVEFDHFKMQAGLTSFVLIPGKWVEKTNAIGIVVKSGRYGGTYAHKDITFEFCSAISPIFKLYLIKEFQRLKDDELKKLGWDIKRNLTPNPNIGTRILHKLLIPQQKKKYQPNLWVRLIFFTFPVKPISYALFRVPIFGLGLTKLNYQIHTEAIKQNLIPPSLSYQQISFIYASEADVLNMALFGKTAKQWRVENPQEKGNIRDFANVVQLVCLANLETLNAVFIAEKIPQKERLEKLNNIAVSQIKILMNNSINRRLKDE